VNPDARLTTFQQFTHTDYQARCTRKIDNIRHEDEDLGFRMWYPRDEYRELMQDCRDEAKAEIRAQYVRNDKGLTLPRKWLNGRVE
jgi:hypothetical protein